MSLYVRNIIFDCREPERLARFWETALGYVTDSADPTTLRSSHAAFPRLQFERVPEPKVAKNRLHLDLGADDREAEVRRLRLLGASELGTVQEDGGIWTVMADPEGNEFCVVDVSSGQGS